MVNLGLFLFSPDQGRDLFRFARDFVRDLPDGCGVFLAGLSARPAPFVPDVGSYVNFMTEYEEDRVRNAYGAKYERLQRVKTEYDPHNVLHLNANIPPS